MLLEARCAATELDVNELERRVVSLTQRIDATNKRLPRRPNINGDQLRAEVKSIDNKLTTTSMKLVEEKTLLRRKDSIKARLKELVAFESSLQEVQVLKEQRGAVIAEKRDKAAQVYEMKQGLRRLRLATRLGVRARDLALETVKVPHEAIGRVIGKKRAALSQLEEDCRVSITEESPRFEPVASRWPPGGSQDSNPLSSTSGSSSSSSSAARVGSTGGTSGDGGGGDCGALLLHLSGTREGVAEASRRLDLTIRTTETVLTASPPLAAALRVSRHALLLRIEGEFRVNIFVGTASAAPSGAPVAHGTGAGGSADGTSTDGKQRDGSSSGGGGGGGGSGAVGGGGGPAENQPGGKGIAGAIPAAAAAAAVAASGRVAEVIIRGVPENVELARAYMAELDCLKLVVPVERKSLSAIFGARGAHIQQMESDFGVSLEVVSAVSKVVLMGVREDVEAAAEKIREISHEFRETEERWPVEPYQVGFLLHNRKAELQAICQRVGGAVSISVKGRATASAAPANPTLEVSQPPSGWGGAQGATHGPDARSASHRAPEDSPTVVESQGSAASSYVLVRGTAPRVSAAGALLLERLKVAERLTAKVSISGKAVPTFVGPAGSSIGKLRRLCVGCEVQLSSVVEGVAEVSLLAEDEAKLASALDFVNKWIRHQQVRTVTVGSETAAMLRTFRAAGVRDKIAGLGRRQDGGTAQAGVRSETGRKAVAGVAGGAGDGEELFGGVNMDSLVAEGVVRLRGGDEELDRAEQILREFQAQNWTTETPVALDDEDVLIRRGLLRDIQSRDTDINFHYLRERRVVVVRGTRQRAEKAAALLQATLHSGGLDAHGMALLTVSWVPVPPTAMNLLTARARFHLKRLSAETGTQMDVVPCASVVRIRARRETGTGLVAGAKRSLLRFVGSQEVDIPIDLARVHSCSSSPLSTAPVSGSRPGSSDSNGAVRGEVQRGSAARKVMQAVDGAGESDDENLIDAGGAGGVGGGAAPVAKKAGGAPVRSVSNDAVRRTVRLHGCEVEFNTKKAKRQDAGGGGASGVAANPGSAHGNRSAAAGGAAAAAAAEPASAASAAGTRHVQSRGVTIRGPPGLAENARDAVVALVMGRQESEVVLGGQAAAAAVVEDDWMKIQESSENVTISPDSSRWSLKICGPPAEVESCRKELYTMLGGVLEGRFVTVPIPHEAMHEVATPLGLADAAAAANLPRHPGDRATTGRTGAAHTAEALGPVGAAAAAGGWYGEANVQLTADWPCSCVRVKGDAPAVREAVEAILAALSKWSALEVATEIESWLVPALFGKQGKAIKKLSQSMGGVVLRVTDGVCRGRATSVESAREATRKLRERVNELRARRIVLEVSPTVMSRLAGRGVSSADKLRERTRATIEIREDAGGEKPTVDISGDPAAVTAAKREVEALIRSVAKNDPAVRAQPESHTTPRNASLPQDTGKGSSSSPAPSLASSRGGAARSMLPSPPLASPQEQESAGEQVAAGVVYDGGEAAAVARGRHEAAAATTIAGAEVDGEHSCDIGRPSTEGDHRERLVAKGSTPVGAFEASTADDPRRAVRSGTGTGTTVTVSAGVPEGDGVVGNGGGQGGNSASSKGPPSFGSFEESKADSGARGRDDVTARTEPVGTEPVGALSSAVGNSSNGDNKSAGPSPSSSGRGTSKGRDKRVSSATKSEAERLLASLLLVDDVAAAAAAAAGTAAAVLGSPTRRPTSSSLHQLEGSLTAKTTALTTSAAAPACGSEAGYFTSSSGIRVRL